MKNKISEVIFCLCSHIGVGEGISPLLPKEWAEISSQLIVHKKSPQDLLDFGIADFNDILCFDSGKADRIKRLLDRGGSLAFEIEKLNGMGINIVTRADEEYPKNLKRKLKQSCPPLFYYCGDIDLLNNESIGYVGSRNVSGADVKFTEEMVKKAVESQFYIASGGAKGVDTVATSEAINIGGVAIEFLSDSMARKIKNGKTAKAIRDGKLVLFSASSPSAGFNVGMAMQRNKYIYAQALGTVVVKADYNKGGTWAGATENLRNNGGHTLCWDNSEYKGNKQLIAQGALPIDLNFDLNYVRNTPETRANVQNSIFDLIEEA